MQTASVVDPHWPALLERLSGVLDLDASARASGALRRRRVVADGATLLRLALAHGPGGLSLRSAAAWAGITGVAALWDVALRKRLRGAADWLGLVAGALLRGIPAALTASPLAGRCLRIVDASGIKSPGAKGTQWRLHADYDPGTARFTGLELTDLHEAEGFALLRFGPGEVALGDRGYARPPGLQHVLASGADFVVRVGWYSLRMTTPEGEPLDWEPIYAGRSHGAPGRGDTAQQGTGAAQQAAVPGPADHHAPARRGWQAGAAGGQPQPQPATVAREAAAAHPRLDRLPDGAHVAARHSRFHCRDPRDLPAALAGGARVQASEVRTRHRSACGA